MKATKSKGVTERLDTASVDKTSIAGYKPKPFGAVKEGDDGKYKIVMNGNSSFYEKKENEVKKLRQDYA